MKAIRISSYSSFTPDQQRYNGSFLDVHSHRQADITYPLYHLDPLRMGQVSRSLSPQSGSCDVLSHRQADITYPLYHLDPLRMSQVSRSLSPQSGSCDVLSHRQADITYPLYHLDPLRMGQVSRSLSPQSGSCDVLSHRQADITYPLYHLDPLRMGQVFTIPQSSVRIMLLAGRKERSLCPLCSSTSPSYGGFANPLVAFKFFPHYAPSLGFQELWFQSRGLWLVLAASLAVIFLGKLAPALRRCHSLWRKFLGQLHFYLSRSDRGGCPRPPQCTLRSRQNGVRNRPNYRTLFDSPSKQG